MSFSRRHFLLSGAAFAAISFLDLAAAPIHVSGSARRLVAAPTKTTMLGPGAPQTDVWAYDGQVPGPVVRLRLGEKVILNLDNRLPQPTTLHWHGMRVPNGMDGVPNLTQPPVAQGERFSYAFEARNSGTFWYHPHFQSAEQVDRGLHGVVVVADETPPEVDRDLVWVIDDWRLNGRAQIVADFADLHDASHQGRLGNTATVNGHVPADFAVRAGERVRLRLVNVANAWIFGLDFTGHDPTVIAYDGHAVQPHKPKDRLVVVGPAQRVDLILDVNGRPGQRFEVVDRFYPRGSYKLLDVVYAEEALRKASPDTPIALPPPALVEPELKRAQRHEVRFTGGAMGGLRSARFQGRDTTMRELVRAGKMWAINGVVASRHDEPSALNLAFGQSHLIDFVNDTAFHHPVHLHGHPMKVVQVEGESPPLPTWRDTLLLAPRSRATVALIADNPGRWMLHCHIPEHQEAGMMAVVTVA